MNIAEYCDAINKDIKITYYNNQANRWTALIEGAEVLEKGMLISAYENGTTPQEAIQKYAVSIRGKTIVFNARDEHKRAEYKVPKKLEGLDNYER